MKGIVFSDLDGTILDAESYTWYPARAGFEWAREENLDIVLSTSKTWSEVEEWRECFHLDTPAIVENGGAVVLDRHHTFAHESGQRVVDAYRLHEMGTGIHPLYSTFEKIRQEGDFHCKSAIEMSPQEFATKTGLDPEEAENALDREFTVPVLFYEGPARKQEFISWCVASDITVQEGGQFLHLQQNCSKGEAVKWLAGKYRNKYDQYATAAIGDSHNDVSMFDQVDYAYAVQTPDGTHDQKIQNKNADNLTLVDEAGPRGWTVAIDQFLEQILTSD